MRVIVTTGAVAVLLAGCATQEVVRFQPTPKQQAMMRDGNPALVSRQANSVVLIRPAGRAFASNGRPTFIVGMNNLGRGPIEFVMSTVAATQNAGGQFAGLHVYTYEELAQEERNRQIAAAILTGVAVAANSYSAAQSGYYSANSRVSTSRGGVYNVSTTGYSPTAAVIAQQNAAVQNEVLVAATIERGQQNMAELEGTILKDNTLLPGEWYGGRLQLQPPAKAADGAKTYVIALQLGPDRHEISIQQGAL